MSRYVQWPRTPEETAIAISEAGEKARELARLASARVPVAPWFAVSRSAFERFMKGNHLEEFLSRTPIRATKETELTAHGTEARRRMLGCSVSPEVAHELWDACGELRAETGCLTFAVRSSALDVPEMAAGARGIYSGSLFVRNEIELLIALRNAWADGFSARAQFARIQRSMPTWPAHAGVIVQAMVDAVSSGRAWRDEAGRIEIRSVWGVSAEGTGDAADRWTIEGGRTRAEICHKPYMFAKGEDGGVTRAALDKDRAGEASLPESAVQEIIKLVELVHVRESRPTVIEWAWADNRVTCVQSYERLRPGKVARAG